MTDPDFTAELLRKASALNELGRPRDALKLVMEGLARDPDNPELLVRATVLTLHLDDYPQALVFAGRAVQMAPQESTPLALLAQARRQVGDYARGKQAAQAALQLDPDDVLAHFELGLLCAIQLEQKGFWQRHKLLQEGRQAAEMVEHHWPDTAHGPALHGMLSAIERNWPRHAQEVERALARDPDSGFAHNVRLMGHQYRRSGSLIPELYERLRAAPADEYARDTLREQFGFQAWLNLGPSWKPLVLVVMSLPFYFPWHWWRVYRHAEAYRAVFTPPERRRQTLLSGLLLLVLLMMFVLFTESLYPLAFTNRAFFYSPLALLLGAGLLFISAPAAFTGKGGFYGVPADRVPPLPVRQPLTFGRLFLPVLLALITLFFVFGSVIITGSPTRTDDLFGMLVMWAITLAIGLATLHFFRRARYLTPPAWRVSPLDGLISLIGLLIVLSALSSFWTTWQVRAERRGFVKVSSPAQRAPFWAYEPGSALDDVVKREQQECALSDGARYVVVRLPGRFAAPLLMRGSKGTVREDAQQTACLREAKISDLRAFPRIGQPLEVQEVP